jgi:hypothetical protein
MDNRNKITMINPLLNVSDETQKTTTLLTTLFNIISPLFKIIIFSVFFLNYI